MLRLNNTLWFLQRIAVQNLILYFGIYNFLRAVQRIIARKTVAQGYGEQIIRHTCISEQLKADKKRGNGTVGHAAEKCGDSYRRTYNLTDRKSVV